MPRFVFDSAHDIDQCVPPNGSVRGSYKPGAAGPGTFHLRFWCATTEELIAEGDVTSDTGRAVPVDFPHIHAHPNQGVVFQCNIRCQFGEGKKGVPTPKCLRTSDNGGQ